MSAITVAELQAVFRLRDELTPSLKLIDQHFTSTGKSLQSLGGQIKDAGANLAPLSAGIAGIGFGAVSMATGLNESLANVSALLTDLSGPELDKVVGDMKGKIQGMSVDMGKSTTDISGGLYEVISSLGLTNDTFGQLEISAKAGAAGLASTQDSFNFLSAVTKTYGDTSEAAFKKAADLGFQAVNLGQTSFPALAASIGGVAPLAQVAGVSMEEMFAVIATATGVTGNTAEVTTQMSSAISGLLNPSKELTEMFVGLGVASGEAFIKEKGFVGALQEVSRYAESTGIPLQDLLGRKEAFVLTASLAGAQAQKFSKDLDAMGKAAGASGGVVEGAFQKQTQGVNAAGFAWKQFKADLEVTMQRIGDSLIPILARAGEQLTPLWQGVKVAVDWFTKLPQPVQTSAVAFAGLLALLSPVLYVLGSMVSMLGGVSLALGGAAGAAFTFGNSIPVLTARLWLMEAAASRMGVVLGVVSQVAAVVGVALASWQVGRWIGDWTGLTDAVGRGTARLGEFIGILPKGTAEQYDASRAAAAASGALQGQTHAVQALTPELKNAVDALGGMGKGADTASAGIARLTDSEKEARKEFQKLVDSMSGKELFTEAGHIVAAVTQIGGAAQLTADESERMAATLSSAIAKYQQRLMTVPPELQKLHDQLTSMPSLLLRIETNKDSAATEVEALRESMQGWLASRPLNVLLLPSANGVNLAATLEPFKKGIVSDLEKPGWLAKAGAGIATNLSSTIMGALKGGGDVGKAVGGLIGGEIGKGVLDKSGNFLATKLPSMLSGVLGSVMPGLGTLAGSLLGQGLSKTVGWFKRLFGGGDDKKAAEEAAQQDAALKRAQEYAETLQSQFREAKGELNGLLGEAEKLGYTFNEQGELTSVSFERMQAVAEKYGISIDALGPKFNGLKIHDAAVEIINDLELLAHGGADIGGALFGAREELSGLVNEAIRTGSELPENMRPYVDELARSGNLLSDNRIKANEMAADMLKMGGELPAGLAPMLQSFIQTGDLIDENTGKSITFEDMVARFGGSGSDAFKKIVAELGLMGTGLGDNQGELTDLAGLKFGDPVKTQFEEITSALKDVVSSLQSIASHISGLPSTKTVTIRTDYVDEGPPPGWADTGNRGGSGNNEGFSTGTMGVTGSWFADFGTGTKTTLHGREAVVREDQAADFAAAYSNRRGDDVDKRFDSIEHLLRDQPRAISLAIQDAFALGGFSSRR